MSALITTEMCNYVMGDGGALTSLEGALADEEELAVWAPSLLSEAAGGDATTSSLVSMVYNWLPTVTCEHPNIKLSWRGTAVRHQCR